VSLQPARISTSAPPWSAKNGSRGPAAADARRRSSEVMRNPMSPTDRNISCAGRAKTPSFPHRTGLRPCSAAVRRSSAAVLGRPRSARRFAASEDRFVGPKRNLLNLRLGIGPLLSLCLVARSGLVHASAPAPRFRPQCAPHDPQPEAAGTLTTRKNRFPSLVTVGGG